MKKVIKIFISIFAVIAILAGACAVANTINAASMQEYIDSFSPMDTTGQLTPQLDDDGSYYFTTDGEFRIMHLTDIHLCGGFLSAENDKKVLNAVAAMISAEKPDLVVATGDISFAVPWYGTLNNGYAHGFFSSLMERLGVYWTVAFGNHDSESYNYLNRPAVARLYGDEALTHCLFSAGPSDVYGECNHTVNVKNSAGYITKSLIMIDTNAYTEDDPIGLGWDYDHVRESQIEWYRGVIEAACRHNEAIYESKDPGDRRPGDEALLIPQSLMFMHIPIREVKEAYDGYVAANRSDTDDITYLGGHDGETGQVVYCPEDDEELFETILELGSTKALFYGHDHLNNFVLCYKGVTLSYGYSMDYSAYSGIDKLGYQRGCSLISCSEGGFTVTHENYYQDKYVPLYEKESVNMSQDGQ